MKNDKINFEFCNLEFEIYADSLGFDLHTYEGEYDDPGTANAWKCWQHGSPAASGGQTYEVLTSVTKKTKMLNHGKRNSFKARPLRNLYEFIGIIHDTNPIPEQKRIADEALALVQRMIEAKHGDTTLPVA